MVEWKGKERDKKESTRRNKNFKDRLNLVRSKYREVERHRI